MLGGWSRKCAAAIVASLLLGDAQAAGPDEMPKAVGKAFIEAETKSWLKSWLDSHPPKPSVTAFGAKTVLVLELLMAADDYAKADTDKERFHAASNGATAFVAYSYAATPAVGLIVTAVYLCAQILEGAIAQSYAEAILEIYQDIMFTEARRMDLVQRAGEARAYRLMVLAEGVQTLIDEGNLLEVQVTADCTARAGDFDTLSNCMALVTRILAAREALVHGLDGILSEPAADLALLSPPKTAGSDGKEPSFRDRLANAREKAKKSVDEIRQVYDKMVASYAALAAAYLEAEAVEGEQRVAAATQVKATCLVEHTGLSKRAATASADLTRISRQLLQAETAAAAVQSARDQRRVVVDLLGDYEQRRLGCPEVFQDAELPKLMALVRGQLGSLGTP